MRISGKIDKYLLGPVIGVGAFAKVKEAKNTDNGQLVAIKILDKKRIIKEKLIQQVLTEIGTMKLLKHPNIVRIHEVIASKTKIYIVMEYIPGGHLSHKLSHSKKLSDEEARKLFQQLIDAVEYCHCRGVYHRDLKPENLLLDRKGNLKVSDFGLSALHKPGSLLATRCGSLSYSAPELIRNREYEGAPADVWACGVILFQMLSGHLPFEDENIHTEYDKISRVDYKFRKDFTEGQRRLLSRIFERDPQQRITIPEIIDDKWFQVKYEPVELHTESEIEEEFVPQQPGFINAFQLIAMSKELDLSGLFEEDDNGNQRIIIVSKHAVTETIKRIEAAARNSCLLVERMKNYKIKMFPRHMANRRRPCVNLLAEVIEVAPTDCIVELSKSSGELQNYQEFCNSLSSLLGDTER